jgi:hypothetical protein
MSSPGIQSHQGFQFAFISEIPRRLFHSEFRKWIFFLHGDGDGEKLSRGDFGAGTGEEAPVLMDSPNSSIAYFFTYFLYLRILGIYFAMHYEIFYL